MARKSRQLGTCIYCGQQTTRGKKGEHIIPEALGWDLTLNDIGNNFVCRECNTGVLSQLDTELCSRSYVSAIASRELEKGMFIVWDVQQDCGNQLVESYPIWDSDYRLRELISLPQVTFNNSSAEFRGNVNEMLTFGVSDYHNVLCTAIKNSYRRFLNKESNAIVFEKIDKRIIDKNHLLSPRIYTTMGIVDLSKCTRKARLLLRYTDDEDARMALNSIKLLKARLESPRVEQVPNARIIRIAYSFDLAKIFRSLLKCSINLIAAFCKNTDINSRQFSMSKELILGSLNINPIVYRDIGFISARHFKEEFQNTSGHIFRLIYADNRWNVYFHFFGGKVNAFARIPGPNHEKWNFIEISAKLKSKSWEIVNEGNILPIIRHEVNWENVSEIIPDVQFVDFKSTTYVNRLPANE